MAERRRRPRRLAHAHVLRAVVAEQRAHAARAHVVGHARAGRFAEEHHGQTAAGGHALHVPDLAAVGGARRCAHHGEVVGDDGALAAVDPAEARDLAVRRRLSRSSGRVADTPNRPDSMNVPGSTSSIDALARVEHARALRRASFSGPPMASALARWPRRHPDWRPSPPVPCDSCAWPFALMTAPPAPRAPRQRCPRSRAHDVAFVSPALRAAPRACLADVAAGMAHCRPASSDSRGTTPAMATLPICWSGASTIELRAR